LKISGIWENTNGEIGLSFKLLQRWINCVL
jgi:hypothetical protein